MLRTHSPYDDSLVAELPFDQGPGLIKKIERANEAQERWCRVPLTDRIERVTAAMLWFQANSDKVAQDITRQMGKPLQQAIGEISGLLERAEYLLSAAPKALAHEHLPPRSGFTRRIEHAPLGLVLNIAAWNYPLLIPTNVIFPALLAGNAVLLKHSARTPLCGTHFERAFQEAGLDHLVTPLVLDHGATAALIADSRVDHVSFTGSVAGGRAIHRAVAERFIDVGLELGGNDPAYVAADADLDLAVAGLVDGACYNAGQSCCAVERAYVHESLYEEFLARAESALSQYVLGDPLQAETTLGPMANATSLQDLDRQVQGAQQAGARLICGGQKQDGRFFLPTLIADCPNSTEIMQEESFGPILPVASVGSDEEAIALVNDTHFGLTASIWTRDSDRAEWFASHHDAGTIFQNRCDYLDPALPWTGYRDSGKGSTLSHHGFHHLTRRKAIHFRN